MSSLWQSTRTSLDDSLALFCASLEDIKAAKPVDIKYAIEQLTTATESARNLRALISSEMPEASWKNREELEALLEKIERLVEARAIAQMRNRLLALANELERGSVVHRRAVRVEQLNQLRDQAIKELRSQAAVAGTPLTLPGPEADEWIEWAGHLQEPEDTESLQALRRGFAHLDDFIANLEPDMWVIKKETPV